MSGEFLKSSPIVSLASAMDSRTSNEFLDATDAQNSTISFNYLQNADLFYSKSLSTRLGTKDLGGGIINASGNPVVWYSYPSGTFVPNVSGTIAEPVYIANKFWDREGMIIIFGSGNYSGTNPVQTFDIAGGDVYINDNSASGNAAESTYDLKFQMYLTEIQNNGVFSGNTAFYDQNGAFLHDINLGGNFNAVPPYPQLINPAPVNSVGFIVDAVPLAITEPITVNFGGDSNYISGAGVLPGTVYGTPWLKIPYQFSAPYPLQYNKPYFLKAVVQNTSGTADRGLAIQATYSDQPQITQPANSGRANAVYGNEYLSFPIANNVIRLAEIPLPNTGVTAWLTGDITKHTGASYNLLEYPAVATTMTAPTEGGERFAGQQFNYGFSPIPSNTNTPFASGQIATFDTRAEEFGNIMTPPSGTYEINGTYFYANAFTGNGYVPFTATGMPLNTYGYNIKYVNKLYEVTSTGTPYTVNQIAAYSGNYAFNNPRTYYDPVNDIAINGINDELEKIYSIYSNPPIVTTDGTKKYITSWQFFDVNTNAPLTDFAVFNIFGSPGQWFYKFISPISVGMSPLPSGNTTDFAVYATGNAFQAPAFVSEPAIACGLLSFQSGNGITLVYDYSIGSSRAEQIIIGQRDRLYTCSFPTPETRELIYTGSQIGHNFLWSATTYQNLLFATQYSNSGTQVCWDQNYTQATGNWTQPWGLQPAWTMFPVSGIVADSGNSNYSGQSFGFGLQSGQSVDVMLSTQMNSGGYRSKIQTFTASGSNTWIGFSGTDIFNVSGTDANSQYKFDVVPQATYVWTTQARNIDGTPVSGTSPGDTVPATTNIFYLAEVLSAASGLSTPCLNPLSNSGTFAGIIQNVGATGTHPNPNGTIYLGNFDSNTLTQQIPNIIDENQAYLTEQIPVPAFKKMVVFSNYIIGAGDPNNPSSIFYCGISPNGLGQPQIFGTDGAVCGFLPVDPNDGSPITGIEVFRDNLYVFKYNAIYRFTYTGNPAQPFTRYTMSNVLGSLGFFGTVSTDYGVFFLSEYGPALVSLGPPDTIGDVIFPTFQQFDRNNLTFAVGIYDRARQQIYWNISNNVESPDNQTGLVYSTAERQWNIRKGGMWLSAGRINDFDNFQQLWIGTSNGQLQQMSIGGTDSDVVFQDTEGTQLVKGITLEGDTEWINFGSSQILHRLKNLRFNCDSSARMLRIDVYYDQNDNQIQYTRYLNMENPVVQRVVSLGGRACRTVKFKITTVGDPAPVKLNSMQLTWSDSGPSTPI